MNRPLSQIPSRIWGTYQRTGIFGLIKKIARNLYPLIIEKPLLLPFLLVLFRLSGERIAKYTLYKTLLPDDYFGDLLGMTSFSERAFLQWYCQELYCGKGFIVELGPFLGASTCSLCRGLALNKSIPNRNGKILVYDRFLCDEFMANLLTKWHLQGRIQKPYHSGDSFRAEFDEQTKSYKSLLAVTDRNLDLVTYNEGSIELLFIDAMKDVAVANHIVRQYYPSLIHGVSLVIHQDFVHFYTSWIHLIQYELRENFKFVYYVPDSSSVVFRYIGAKSETKNYQLNIDAFDDRMIDAAFAYSCSLVPSAQHANILASKIMLYLHKGDLRSARLLYDRLAVEYVEVPSEVGIVRDILSEREGQR